MEELILTPKATQAGFWSYFSSSSFSKAIESEAKLLERDLTFAGSSDTKLAASIGLVEVDSAVSINTLHINPIHASTKLSKPKNVVICHGYGAGLAFFYKNYKSIGNSGHRIFSIDLPGLGLGSRHRFPQFNSKSSEDDIINQTEAFFIHSIEKWRDRMKLDKIILVGHSLGGYLSSAYALKYPDRVEKLILVSPVGVPVAPPPDDSAPKPSLFSIRSILLGLFNASWTPMSVVRAAGPFGHSLVNLYTTRRFSYLGEQELKDFTNYLYQISALSGSGEFALPHLLMPGAYARRPLHGRLRGLQMPVTFICK
jgi:cardiolipin-specific phospholipase